MDKRKGGIEGKYSGEERRGNKKKDDKKRGRKKKKKWGKGYRVEKEEMMGRGKKGR